ncbi:MAG TPA: aconitate hydratase AcnA [Thermodesulfovibrionales bacterium]|jgi:aconitate hydratase|nr:aconitate hydratase AcnA [Thermodesulfovibrionales bacterium]
MSHNLFNTLREFDPGNGKKGRLYSLPALERAGFGRISRLPVSIRVVLESVLRNYDGKKITEDHVSQLARWSPGATRVDEIPFVVARIVLQDFTGVPLLCDLAAMRSAALKMGKDPKIIEPLVPVDLVVDHSVQIDYCREPDAVRKNMEIEFRRNKERYQFLKWGMNAFNTFKVIPPGVGIIHQVNLEYLARGVHNKAGLYYPDTLVGTDSHTTMINGIGVVGWGVGGIEAEAGMLGQPVYFLTPDVVGVNLKGNLKEGLTATDLVLTITEILRKEKVVGTFVEFFGEGAASLALPDRTTVANMAPEYGATMGFFPVDDITVDFFRGSGRTGDEIAAFQSYFRAQGMYGMPRSGELEYSKVIEIDLSEIKRSVAGPKRPQDRIELSNLRETFSDLFTRSLSENGFARKSGDLGKRFKTREGVDVGSGDVIIAAITSCTNTSNPAVLLGAGLLAKKAVEKGLAVKRHVKTSLAPGSRVVTEYLKKAGLLPYLEELGFSVAAYGCTTCIGNAGPLPDDIEETIVQNDLVCAAVLSGNRNFEARIHPNLHANFLMSPPLVVAFAIAGTVLRNMESEPLGRGKDGQEVYLRDIWPGSSEIAEVMKFATDPETFRRLYSDLTKDHVLWNSVSSVSGEVYDWPKSTYIAEPPFFQGFTMQAGRVSKISNARALGIFGDSVTTDHISPAGSIKETSPAGRYLIENNVPKADFQSYGTRRGNHHVMVRGTFANVRIRNLMMPPKADGSRIEGGFTIFQPSGEEMSIYDAAVRYLAEGVPTVVFGGEEYGTGSSRDWAAKGTQLLGVKAVIAKSFERIHRSNLVGMGVLPLQFKGNDTVQTLNIRGDEEFDILVPEDLRPQQDIPLVIRRRDGAREEVGLLSRIDTAIEFDYYRHGGILPYVLRELIAEA